jgi:3-deoxy-D-manno-octulosonic-acid transferase
LADVAFVGGSLVPVGGHNLLEPAIHGVPVLFGRYVESCQEVAQRLKAAGGGFECEADSLESVLYELLTNEERRKEAGLQAKRIAACDADVIERHLDLIERVLTHAGGR